MTTEQDCLAVLAEELGPAAKAFMIRQCRSHLNKEPSQLQKFDLDEFAKWCYAGIQVALGAQIAENVKKGLLALKQKT
ncbi:MAG TPA: hypothetical protein VMD05_03675 [Candidatus Nanoarchaeia archaeon]|nr:hypothetical protein [Candidatus Nanoarchaeia archaeon]